MSATGSIHAGLPMREILAACPGAQRALFRRYHIGGCANCGFSLDETLEEVCRRNAAIDPAEALAHIQTSHEQDEKVLIGARELSEWREKEPSLRKNSRLFILKAPNCFRRR